MPDTTQPEGHWTDAPHTHAGTDCGGGEGCPAAPQPSEAAFIEAGVRILADRGVNARPSDLGRVWDWLAAQPSAPVQTAVEALRETREHVVRSRGDGKHGVPFQRDPKWEWSNGLIDGLDLAALVVRRGEPVDPVGMTFPLGEDDPLAQDHSAAALAQDREAGS